MARYRIRYFRGFREIHKRIGDKWICVKDQHNHDLFWNTGDAIRAKRRLIQMDKERKNNG